jgi:hypothetical protein
MKKLNLEIKDENDAPFITDYHAPSEYKYISEAILSLPDNKWLVLSGFSSVSEIRKIQSRIRTLKELVRTAYKTRSNVSGETLELWIRKTK